MIPGILRKIFGSRNDRLVRQIGLTVIAVIDAQVKSKTNALEEMKKSKWWQRSKKTDEQPAPKKTEKAIK